MRTPMLTLWLGFRGYIYPYIFSYSVNIELESPVVVVPRNAHSTQVFVAHLGRMSLANRPGPPHHTLYKVRVRDISLATVSI